MTEPFAPKETRLEPPAEHLSIGLLLLWTAMTGVLLGFHRATNQPTNGELGIVPTLMSFITSPLIAIGMSAWVLMLWRWFNDGPRFPSQPGHWLLLLFSFTGVVLLVARMVFMISLIGLRGSGVYVGLIFITELLALILNVAAINGLRDRWQILFAIGAASTALRVTMMVMMRLDFQLLFLANFVQQLLAWGFGLTMLGLALADLRQGVRRDTLHWLGVLVIGGYLIYATAVPWIIRWVQ